MSTVNITFPHLIIGPKNQIDISGPSTVLCPIFKVLVIFSINQPLLVI